MKIKSILKRIINKLPYIRGLQQQIFDLKKNSCYPPGHFYSPVISIEDIKNRQFEIWKSDENVGIQGIELEVNVQKELIEKLTHYYKDLPFSSGRGNKTRYHYENDYYSYTDGIVLYSMIRHYRPRKIIEIGSGFSSAVMLDTNELFFDNKIDLTFIEPYPQRLISLLAESDKRQDLILRRDVQSVSLEEFKRLEAGDFLFVDSSHVVKTGSDVNYILFEILPILNRGVLIHFHDVFFPFEYPKEWVFDGRNWNEDYFLKAFLMYNKAFKIKLFSHYLHKHHKEVFKEMPLTYKNAGGNLWLEKQ